MKSISIILTSTLLLTTSLFAKGPLDDYSFIRGACHRVTDDQVALERDMGFMTRLQLNSTRVWLSKRPKSRPGKRFAHSLTTLPSS